MGTVISTQMQAQESKLSLNANKLRCVFLYARLNGGEAEQLMSHNNIKRLRPFLFQSRRQRAICILSLAGFPPHTLKKNRLTLEKGGAGFSFPV